MEDVGREETMLKIKIRRKMNIKEMDLEETELRIEINRKIKINGKEVN